MSALFVSAFQRDEPAGAAEPAFTAQRFVEFFNLEPRSSGDRREHQLGYAVTAPHLERIVPVVDQDDLQFATIIGIDRAPGCWAR